MGIGRILFSPRGRINRARFWIGNIILAVGWVGGAPIIAASGNWMTGGSDAEIFVFVGLFLIVALLVAVNVAFFMIGIKRYHDRDKTGWWVLITLVPFIGVLLYLIECGFLSGTNGANRFGPDPLDPDAIAKTFD